MTISGGYESQKLGGYQSQKLVGGLPFNLPLGGRIMGPVTLGVENQSYGVLPKPRTRTDGCPSTSWPYGQKTLNSQVSRCVYPFIANVQGFLEREGESERERERKKKEKKKTHKQSKSWMAAWMIGWLHK